MKSTTLTMIQSLTTKMLPIIKEVVSSCWPVNK